MNTKGDCLGIFFGGTLCAVSSRNAGTPQVDRNSGFWPIKLENTSQNYRINTKQGKRGSIPKDIKKIKNIKKNTSQNSRGLLFFPKQLTVGSGLLGRLSPSLGGSGRVSSCLQCVVPHRVAFLHLVSCEVVFPHLVSAHFASHRPVSADFAFHHLVSPHCVDPEWFPSFCFPSFCLPSSCLPFLLSPLLLSPIIFFLLILFPIILSPTHHLVPQHLVSHHLRLPCLPSSSCHPWLQKNARKWHELKKVDQKDSDGGKKRLTINESRSQKQQESKATITKSRWRCQAWGKKRRPPPILTDGPEMEQAHARSAWSIFRGWVKFGLLIWVLIPYWWPLSIVWAQGSGTSTTACLAYRSRWPRRWKSLFRGTDSAEHRRARTCPLMARPGSSSAPRKQLQNGKQKLRPGSCSKTPACRSWTRARASKQNLTIEGAAGHIWLLLGGRFCNFQEAKIWKAAGERRHKKEQKAAEARPHNAKQGPGRPPPGNWKKEGGEKRSAQQAQAGPTGKNHRNKKRKGNREQLAPQDKRKEQLQKDLLRKAREGATKESRDEEPYQQWQYINKAWERTPWLIAIRLFAGERSGQAPKKGGKKAAEQAAPQATSKSSSGVLQPCMFEPMKKCHRSWTPHHHMQHVGLNRWLSSLCFPPFVSHNHVSHHVVLFFLKLFPITFPSPARLSLVCLPPIPFYQLLSPSHHLVSHHLVSDPLILSPAIFSFIFFFCFPCPFPAPCILPSWLQFLFRIIWSPILLSISHHLVSGQLVFHDLNCLPPSSFLLSPCESVRQRNDWLEGHAAWQFSPTQGILVLFCRASDCDVADFDFLLTLNTFSVRERQGDSYLKPDHVWSLWSRCARVAEKLSPSNFQVFLTEAFVDWSPACLRAPRRGQSRASRWVELAVGTMLLGPSEFRLFLRNRAAGRFESVWGAWNCFLSWFLGWGSTDSKRGQSEDYMLNLTCCVTPWRSFSCAFWSPVPEAEDKKGYM